MTMIKDMYHTKDFSKVSIEHVYQPMWNLENWTILGYEALIRFTNLHLNLIVEETFDLARKHEELYELDTLSISQSLAGFPHHLKKINYFS